MQQKSDRLVIICPSELRGCAAPETDFPTNFFPGLEIFRSPAGNSTLKKKSVRRTDTFATTPLKILRTHKARVRSAKHTTLRDVYRQDSLRAPLTRAFPALLGCWGLAGWALCVVIAAKNMQLVLLLSSDKKQRTRPHAVRVFIPQNREKGRFSTAVAQRGS